MATKDWKKYGKDKWRKFSDYSDYILEVRKKKNNKFDFIVYLQDAQGEVGWMTQYFPPFRTEATLCKLPPPYTRRY